MILTDHQLGLKRNDVGAKALNLRRLQKAGFLVPRFVVIPAKDLSRLWKKKSSRVSELRNLGIKIHDALGCKNYAVRSSALIEDRRKNSMAGMFKTVLAVKPRQLGQAIGEVLGDAEKKMKGNLKNFALIVQSFVEPDRSGVAFTRSPQGSPLMLIEWIRGRGDSLVDGRVVPHRESHPWSSAPEDFKKIETLYGWPQDIEWCEKGGKRYFLQTRPVTTIKVRDYEKMKKSDALFPEKGLFWYEKTDLSAAFPRPSAETLNLLEIIYGEGGPVQLVYKKHRIAYQPQPFRKVILGELFVDREAEWRSLFPAYGLHSVKKNRPVFRLKSLQGLMTTLRNHIAVERMSLDDHELYDKQLRSLLMDDERAPSSDHAMRKFLEVYEVIFATNLKTTRALHLLKTALGKHSEYLQDLLSKGSSKKLLHWWNGLSDFRRSWLTTFLERARRWQELRESARLLTVKHMNRLRDSSPQLVLEATSVSLPLVITNLHHPDVSTLSIVSRGEARGVLMTVDTLRSGTKNGILYSPLLSPSLAEYLPSLKGIITEQGGMLSHMAILAREKNIPVLVGVPMREIKDLLGKRIHLDGAKGAWTLEESSSGH